MLVRYYSRIIILLSYIFTPLLQFLEGNLPLLLGFEIGGNKLRGFIEPIAVSPQGLIHGGIKYDF